MKDEKTNGRKIAPQYRNPDLASESWACITHDVLKGNWRNSSHAGYLKNNTKQNKNLRTEQNGGTMLDSCYPFHSEQKQKNKRLRKTNKRKKKSDYMYKKIKVCIRNSNLHHP